MNTDTPRTDAICNGRDDGTLRLQVEQLERELTEATNRAAFFESAMCEQGNIVTRIEEQLRIALEGHPESHLWGENGLIAATMRCVRSLDMIEDIIADADCTAEETLSKICAIISLPISTSRGNHEKGETIK